MSAIAVTGWGVVSPAGWGLPAFRAALAQRQLILPQKVMRPGWEHPLLVREVPTPHPAPSYFMHPRLRRASPITLYAAGAATEALASAEANGSSKPSQLGLIVCMMSGCVQYTQRFFDETLRNPATASPLVFPETVFNAPASHLAVLLGNSPLACTLIGDPSVYLQGLALAADWLLAGRVEGCLVVGAEETNWLLADVLWHFDHGATLAGGAGALYLCRSNEAARSVRLEQITSPYLFTAQRSRARAAWEMRQSLPPCTAGDILCDGTQNRQHADADERAAWTDWSETRLSPKAILGEGLMASGPWQCVAACDALTNGHFQAANVSMVGVNQQAIGARFTWKP